ncbi:hypothetical protein KGQ34_03765 [Patescibacteria group bacterium]|nr:hypothetical protein [Patescibacteria group bacterium]
MFDIQNKKDRLKQRFDAFRKDMKTDASKKISDVVVKNATVIDLSRVKPRFQEPLRNRKSGDNAAAAVFSKKKTHHNHEKKESLRAAELALPMEPEEKAKRKIRLWWGACGVLLVFVFLLLTFAFDRAAVAVTPAEEHFLLKGVGIGVDTSLHSVDVLGKRLPGLRIEVAKSAEKSFPTSGKKYLQSRAQGVITVTNNYSVTSQPLVRNTRFVEQGGKVFHLIRGAVIPGMSVKDGKLESSSIDIEVIADQPGDGYNIPPANFKIPGFAGTPKYDKFLAVSRNSFGGGYVGETGFATNNDIRNASEQVTKEAYDAVKTELAGKIPSGFVAADGARLIQITGVKKPLGLMLGDSFEFSASADGFVILFKQSDFAQLLEAIAVPPDKKMSFQEDKSQIAFSKIAMRRDGSGFDATLDGDVLFRYRIDSDSIKNGIVSLSQENAGQWLRTRQDIASFEFKMFPSWIKTMPSSASSMSVEVR